MEGIDLFNAHQWHPFSGLGLTHPFFAVQAETVINTWILLLIIIVLVIAARLLFTRHQSVARFLIISFVRNFADMVTQTVGSFSFNHFSFVTALFIFIALANCMMVIPFVDEPTADLNTTLALGIIAFFYIQISAIKAHGIIEYLKEYFTPFFVMFPLHVVGKLATIISMSFRLFGNIFGGATIADIYLNAIKGSLVWESFGLISGLNLAITLFFGIFEGFLQAFVFTMLTLTYLSIALQEEEVEHPKEST